MMTKEFDVVAVGDANIDLVFKVPALPKNDSKVVGKKLLECGGGTVANSACVLGQLGAKVVSLSQVGNDHNAQLILNDFKRFKVDTRFIQVIPDLAANTAVIFLDDTGEKALVYAPGGEAPIDKNSYQQAIRASRILYTMPGDIDKFIYMASLAKQYHTKIAVDIESHIADTPEKLDQILTYSHIVIFNLAGFISCTQRQPTEHEIRQLVQQYQLELIVITCGAEGAIVVTDTACYRHPGFKVDVIDTTGAGDTFNAAFIHALLRDYPLAKALAFACAAAAIVIGYLGARTPLPTLEEINRVIRNNENN